MTDHKDGATDGGVPETESTTSARPRRWRTALRWGERILFIALLIFLAERLGPRITAWTGIGPSFAPVERLEAALPPAVGLDGFALPADRVEAAGESVRVITFWATWCRVCSWELPVLQRVYDDLAHRGVEVLALSIDQGGPGVVLEYRERRGFTVPMAMAAAGAREAFGGIPGIPTTFIVGADGVIHHRIVGASGPGTIRRAAERLLEDG